MRSSGVSRFSGTKNIKNEKYSHGSPKGEHSRSSSLKTRVARSGLESAKIRGNLKSQESHFIASRRLLLIICKAFTGKNALGESTKIPL